MLTDKEIQNLMKAQKKIHKKEPKTGYKNENGHKKCDLILSLHQSHLKLQTSSNRISFTGQNESIKFIIFIRQSQAFIENFSIGLRCQIPSLKSSVTLVRYNGPHGQIKRNKSDHHPEPHIHYITQEEIKSGAFNPKAKNIKITDKYTTFEEGLRAFLTDMKIVNWTEYFPELEQRRFFNGY